MSDATVDRASGIGASDAAAVLGLHPYRTPFTVWLEKTGQHVENADSEWTRLGKKLEPVVADLYMDRIGRRSLTTCETTRHRDISFLFATPDYADKEAGKLVECKAVFSPRQFRFWGEEGTGAIPVQYAVQCIMQAACCDVETVDVAALVGGNLRIYSVHRDLERERRIIDALSQWWSDYVVGNKSPSPDGSNQAGEWLKKRWAKNSDELLQLSDNSVMTGLWEAKQAVETATAVFESKKQALQLAIADSAGAEGDGITATWKRSKDRTVVDWESVAREAYASEALINKHTKIVAGSRVFRLSKHEEK